MSRGRSGVLPPGVIVKVPPKKSVPKPPEDIVKKFLFLNPRPNGKGTPKAPYTRMQNKHHKKGAPPYPKGLVPHKVKVVVRVQLGPELLKKREPGDHTKWKAFTVHTTGITKRGTNYLCMADPRVLEKLKGMGYKIPDTNLLRVVMDDNPLLWIPNLEAYSWWYPQPAEEETPQ